MKNTLFLVFSFLIVSLYQGQISFFRAYSDFGYDKGEGITQLEDSSYLITGSSSSFTSSSQAFVLHVDSVGNRISSHHYGGSESDMGKRIFQVPNDGIYVCGQSNSNTENFYDAYFFKTDFAGNLLYEKHYGGSNYEEIQDAVMLKDTSFILVGYTESTPNETANLYLLRINRFGDTLWTKNMGSEGNDIAHSIKIFNDTTVIIGGEYYISDSLNTKAFLMKMNIDGTIYWNNHFGNNAGKYVLKDFVISSGFFRCVGYHQLEDVENQTFAHRLFVNLDGEFDSDNVDFAPGNQYYNLISENTLASTYYGVLTARKTGYFDLYDNQYADLVIRSLTEFINPIDFGFYSREGDDIANQLIPTNDGGAILVGYNENPPLGGANVILVKIGKNATFPQSHTLPQFSTLVSIQENSGVTKSEIYPNPNEGKFRITLAEQVEKENLKVFNTLGQEIKINVLFSEQFAEINLARFSTGIYFLEISNTSGLKTLSKFVIK
jgi:hypothetical protein